MPARFKLDENLPRDTEALLHKAGHDVHTILDEGLGGNPDLRVFDASQEEDRILVTFDLDFSDIRVYPPASHKGGCGLSSPAGSVSESNWRPAHLVSALIYLGLGSSWAEVMQLNKAGHYYTVQSAGEALSSLRLWFAWGSERQSGA